LGEGTSLASDEEESGLLVLVREWAFGPESPAPPMMLAGRGVLLVALALWSLSFFAMAMDGDRLAASFMHLVHLPFHEAGHIVFMPFGSLLTALGGTLMQLLVPLLCAGALLRRLDRFGAAVGLWWTGQSLMDIAPYVADARALRLMLLGGHTGAEVEGHDWEAILSTLGWLRYDVTLGRAANLLGILLMLAALAWGARVLWRQRQAGHDGDAGVRW
jgi:hypothetical protein